MGKVTRGTIAAGDARTAAAGIEMFRLGGNAFDAAAAAVLASFVTESSLTSAAGGGFLLAHTQNNQNILFDFFSQTPIHKRPQQEVDFYPIDVNFGDAIQEFHIGLGAIATPGNIGGIYHVQQKLGKLPFHVVTEPAIHYAKYGIEVNEFQTYCWQILQPILTATKAARQIYAPQGVLLEVGDKLFMPDFAATLNYLAERGVQEFYRGDIARQLIKDCQTDGGYLTDADLAEYQVIEREPLTINYRGNTLLTNPPPSSGGILIAFALELLAQFELSKIGFGTPLHLQILTAVMRLTDRARKENYDTNVYQTDITEIFLAAAQITEYASQLNSVVNKWGSTTHLSVVDDEGNAASVTTSNGEGCGYIIPGTGIMLNNMLGEDDINPHGFHQWQENVRISSMMSPTIVLKDNRPEIVLGSGGSKRIRTAILQVISNIIDFQMPVDLAVNSSRLHWEDNVLNLEPGWNEEAIANLISADETSLLWNKQNMFFGGVHTVMEDESGIISGAGDKRRNGAIASI
jgi:gamma-glutamyltranspeptidase / glutathione hydrolase